MENDYYILSSVALFGIGVYPLIYYLISNDSYPVLPVSALIVTVILIYEYRQSDDSLTLATLVTIFRGYLSALVFIPIILGVYDESVLTIFSMIYGASVLLDNIDGRLARYKNVKTDLGRRLDVRFDTFGMLLVSLLLVLSSSVHPSYLIVGLLGYLFNIYLQLREIFGYQVYAYAEDNISRTIAGFQMFYATIALSPLLSGDVAVYASIIATSITVIVFTRDTLSASGFNYIKISTKLTSTN